MHACFAQHMDVDPGRYKVGESARHDNNALALKEAAVVGRCILLKGLQLCLSTPDTSSVSNQINVNAGHFHTVFMCLSGHLRIRKYKSRKGVDECTMCTCTHNSHKDTCHALPDTACCFANIMLNGQPSKGVCQGMKPLLCSLSATSYQCKHGSKSIKNKMVAESMLIVKSVPIVQCLNPHSLHLWLPRVVTPRLCKVALSEHKDEQVLR